MAKTGQKVGQSGETTNSMNSITSISNAGASSFFLISIFESKTNL